MNRLSKFLLVFLIICVILNSGCYYTYEKSQYRELDMGKISIGMSEEDVREALGEPADVIGSQLYPGGHIVRVLQYMEAEFSHFGPTDRLKKNYYLYFLDDIIIQWGRPGDWQRTADQIYEFRIR